MGRECGRAVGDIVVGVVGLAVGDEVGSAVMHVSQSTKHNVFKTGAIAQSSTELPLHSSGSKAPLHFLLCVGADVGVDVGADVVGAAVGLSVGHALHRTGHICLKSDTLAQNGSDETGHNA